MIAGIGAAEHLGLAVRDAALAGLHGDILHDREIGMAHVGITLSLPDQMSSHRRRITGGARRAMRSVLGALFRGRRRPPLPVTCTWLVTNQRWFSSSTGVKLKHDFGPAADAVHAGERRHDHAHDVRRVVQRMPHLAVRALAEAQHAPVGFFAR